MTSPTRRTFLQTGAASLAGAALVGAGTSPSTTAAETSGKDDGKPGGEKGPAPFIDTNVHLGHWPARHLPLGKPADLTAKLREHGVTQAWAGTFEGLLHKDLAAANYRLKKACEVHGAGLLVPVGAINPTLPAWKEDLKRCREDFDFSMIRLYPGYHGYAVEQPLFLETLKQAREVELTVQVVVRLEDVRTQSPLLRAPDLDVTPLPGLLKKVPGIRLQLLNALRTVKNPLLLQRLAAMGVHFEIAMLEGAAGLENLLNGLGIKNVCFGSHAPFFYFESALLKLKESLLTEEQLTFLRDGNARNFFIPPQP